MIVIERKDGVIQAVHSVRHDPYCLMELDWDKGEPAVTEYGFLPKPLPDAVRAAVENARRPT